jgi:pantetheine-phosphate adenylyltransferase
VSDSAPITAICPGSYDPVTNGHLDIITRAAGIFDRVVVGVVRDPQHKKAMFPVEERVQFLRDALGRLRQRRGRGVRRARGRVRPQWGATTMVKGLRAISDFEWEFRCTT